MNALKVAHLLLDTGCLALSPHKPFTYASGLKGPMYCDNRKLLSYPDAREQIIFAFKELIEKEGLKFDHYAGLATAGIPHAALLAGLTKKSMVYVRSKPKAHGKRQQVEGAFEKGQSLLLVEDLINQGASLNEAMLGVDDAGLKVSACLAIVHYETTNAAKILKDWNLKLCALTDLSSIIKAALEKSLIDEQGALMMKEWQEDPKAWSKKYDDATSLK